MDLADRVMGELTRRGARQHPLVYDLCHTILVDLMEAGVRVNVVAQITRLVGKAIDDEVAYMDHRVLWDDVECVKELRAEGLL